MDLGVVVLVIVLVVVLIIGIAFAIFYSPNYQPRYNHHNGNRKKHVPNYVLGLRSQVGTDVLPAIAIDVSPTDITFNQPTCESGFTKINRSGVYQILYGVDVQFTSSAIASLAVRRRSSDGCNGFEILSGSARQFNVSPTDQLNTVPLTHSFFAQLNNGDQLKLTAVASVADTVSVPSSSSSFLQAPESLTFIQLILQS